MNLRGYLALIIVCVGLLLLDPVQRLVIAPWAALRPSSRIRVLTRWIQGLAWWVTQPINAIAGSRIPAPPRVVPSEPDTLILMNHQSLFDIPLVIKTVDGGYPRIITRARYGRKIPLISHMTRLYQYPQVEPAANPGAMRKMLGQVRDAARNTTVPLALFPEGNRSRDGEIAPFRTKGLELILRAKPWKVYVVVVDGFWKQPRFKDFMRGLSHLEGQIEVLEPLDWSDPKAPAGPFMDQIREMMIERLAAMRAQAATS